jgi:hypothetical protein
VLVLQPFADSPKQVRVDPIDHPRAGDRIHLQADASAVHVFDAESGERLN